MPTGQVVTRVVVYGFALGVIDSVSGRTLQASPDPSILLSLAAVAWVAFRLAENNQSRLAFSAAVGLWIVYFGAFLATSRLLVGWNGSAPWQQRSTSWMMLLAAMVPLVALLAQFAGSLAAARAGLKPSRHSPRD